MVIAFLKKESTLAAILAITMVIVAVSTQKWAYRYMNKESIAALAPLNLADSIQNSIINSTLKDTTAKVITLKRQYLISDEIKTLCLSGVFRA
jgi:cbb3-type cytochrome oxidase subunit 3